LSDFLKPRPPQRTRICLPLTVLSSAGYDIVATTECNMTREIYIERDNERIVTIKLDGEIVLHQHP
jgi:hypothetical protein